MRFWFLAMTTAVICFVNLDAYSERDSNSATCQTGGLFEGDILTSIDTIRRFYDLSKTQEKALEVLLNGNKSGNVSPTSRRAAIADEDGLWTNGIVPYHTDPSLPDQLIQGAIREWECSTCLRFIPRSTQMDYVFFTDNNCGCNSHVGRIGYRQDINLGCFCRSHRTVLHEIGHALGFWHEHTRPDRDNYVTIDRNNIRTDYPGYEGDILFNVAFMKRSPDSVNNYSTIYDYGSVMHYRRNAFAINPSQNTIDINNNEVFMAQGSPEVGWLPHLSYIDIVQTNRLYSCPEPGQHGFLLVFVRYGELGSRVPNVLYPYVKIEAVDSTGMKYDRRTPHDIATTNPTWNKMLLFSNKEWRYFTIQVLNDSITPEEISIATQSIPLQSCSQKCCTSWRKHCVNTLCSDYIWFDFKVVTPVCGQLLVTIERAHNLPNTDPYYGLLIGRMNNVADPYVRIKAYQYTGSEESEETTVKHGTFEPVWYEQLDFDIVRDIKWVAFTVQIWDKDTDGLNLDDKISEPEVIRIAPESQNRSVPYTYCISSTCDAYLDLSYQVVPRTSECAV